MSDELRSRGLPSIEEARRTRSKMRWPSVRFWLWAGIALMAMAIFHWRRTAAEVERGRQTLLARQRAVAVELGGRWTGLRERVETWTTELANAAQVDSLVDAVAVQGWEFRDKPGLYLRLPQARARDVEGLRASVKESLRDGFTACLTQTPNDNPLAGKECRRTHDCGQGEWCNELDHCSKPAQPYNLRVAYRTLNVLGEAWIKDAQSVDSELRLRLLSSTFDEIAREDLPIAADLLTRAQYYLVVLDELGGAGAQAGASAPAVEAALAAPHFSRVGLWRLSDGKLVLRWRTQAEAELVGPAAPSDPLVAAARARQANACALALGVRQAMGAAAGP